MSDELTLTKSQRAPFLIPAQSDLALFTPDWQVLEKNHIVGFNSRHISSRPFSLLRSQMVKRMKADDGMKGIPVVIVSTEGSATRINGLLESGVRAFLRKPFTPESLKTTIDSIMGK